MFVCDFRVCPSAHTGRLWLSISTHISTLVLGLSTLALPVDCLGDFGPRGLSVQYTQDVCGCPPAHTGRPGLSMAVCSTHRTSVTVDVCPCVSVRTHRMSVAVHVCPCVSVSTHRTSVAVHQYTYQHHVGPWTQHADPSRGLFGTHRTSVGVRQHTQDVCGCMWLSVSTHRTSMAIRVCSCVTHMTSVCVRQHTQDVRGYPSVHISARWSLDSACWPFPRTVRVISAHVGCLFSTHRTSYTQDVRGCPPAHTGRLGLSVDVCQHTQDVHDCPCVSVRTHRTSVGVCQHTQDVRVCPSAHT
ncbi:unnamed protein product [Brassica rapa]|uniref:Uncharacterized protein n=1 Tax=Brassica campestris TaxID=3711 RepID=A0A8D9CUZ5_BRACM|nr:unnamed protein product [Brassica rapa]